MKGVCVFELNFGEVECSSPTKLELEITLLCTKSYPFEKCDAYMGEEEWDSCLLSATLWFKHQLPAALSALFHLCQ